MVTPISTACTAGPGRQSLCDRFCDEFRFWVEHRQQQFDELGSDMPDELTYDVYVDEANRIRRTTTEISAGGMKAEIDIVIKPSGEPIVIEVPAPADVTDAADLL